MKTILVDAINNFIIKDQGINQELFNLLEKYPHQKIILTNVDNDQIQKFGLIDLPYPIFTLKHNPNKDNPHYFKTLLEKYNLIAENCLYFDHNQNAISSAESIGINSLLFEYNKTSIQVLQDFLDNRLI